MRDPKVYNPAIAMELAQLAERRDDLEMDRNTLSYVIRWRDQFQRLRVSGHNITSSAKRIHGEDKEDILTGLIEFASTAEKQFERFFSDWVACDPLASKVCKIKGVGKISALKLQSFIDISMCETASRVWRFAGLDPTQPKPKKGEKLTFCRPLKTCVLFLAEGFKKLSKDPASWYGMAYRTRKSFEEGRNAKGQLKSEAERALAEKNIKKKVVKKIYESGKLPPGHLDRRALRWTAKLFLAHWFTLAYRLDRGKEPPLPYIIGIKGHSKHVTVDDVFEWEAQNAHLKRPPRKKKKVARIRFGGSSLDDAKLA